MSLKIGTQVRAIRIGEKFYRWAMTGRSLCCSPEGIEKARKALDYHSLSQKALAEELGMSRQPVTNFFAGKRIDRKYFYQICERLKLEWDEIVAKPPSEPEAEANQDNSVNIDALVQEVREKIKPDIQERCGTMRVLDMSQPIGLNDIYTNVNILEKVTGRKRKKIAELLQECNSEDFERFGLGRISEQRVPGLVAVEKSSKLMILGKPGAGKTTFLKYLAIQCNRAEFQAGQVPIFVSLKDFAEATGKPGLLKYISQQFAGCGIVREDAVPLADELLKHGRTLVLLDGLDEVREEDTTHVLKEIRDFSDHFRDNHFVMTCRIAAREYTFDKFTEVEVADFDDEQIATFATQWFKDKAVKAETFIQRIKDNNRIKQLAASPLLLTLLCLAFEESGNFPANRSELYKEGLDALLKKWDAKRGIYRTQLYKKLSVQRKEDLLSKIALTTFEGGDYFFKQKVAEQYIKEYIRNLPDANTDPEALQLDSEVILRSIEAQHGLLVERAKGIYSFSHLTFHEYFTAREIMFGEYFSEEVLQNLVSHISDKRWREVFLLAVGMSSSGDRLLLLMKQQVDALVTADEKLQRFLVWVNQKSISVKTPYKPAAVRAFNFEYFTSFDFVLSSLSDNEIVFVSSIRIKKKSLNRDLISSLIHLVHLINDKMIIAISDNCISCAEPAYDFATELVPSVARELKQVMQQLRKQLPKVDGDKERLEQWWKANDQFWTEQIRAIIIKYRNIGQYWKFSEYQMELLEQYHDANKLLVECLNSDVVLTPEVRSQIEDTLLLPITEIEKRK
ncbi:MAG TPA: NACHT domain-containing NTPase [Waterburya sp.]|jgi:predicted NACHT family NTPase